MVSLNRSAAIKTQFLLTNFDMNYFNWKALILWWGLHTARRQVDRAEAVNRCPEAYPLNSHLIFSVVIFSVVTWRHKLRSKYVLMFLCYVSTKILPWLKIAWSNKQIGIDLNKNLLPVTWFFFDYNLIDSSLLPLIAQWNWRPPMSWTDSLQVGAFWRFKGSPCFSRLMLKKRRFFLQLWHDIISLTNHEGLSH